uniref:Uncharacterized protein n=1 Tax=Meloidogyne enterolobii TaxID=390850 RepID=A0A6V7V788_MELEN|nr:unnamed protein product [Meloidogyne enterolobii]
MKRITEKERLCLLISFPSLSPSFFGYIRFIYYFYILIPLFFSFLILKSIRK